MAATAGQQPGLQIQVAGEVRDGSSLLSSHPTTNFTPPFQEHETNLYSMLGVPKDSEPEQIKWAYRRLLLQYHPDKNDKASPHIAGTAHRGSGAGRPRAACMQ